jgi:pimeloyl-ACP methyl ester carboxylesterase
MDDWQREGLAPFRLKIDYLPELSRLSCPSLWLRGKNDPLVGREIMEEAAAAAPSSSLVVFEDAGHLLPLERPEAVEARMAAFFQAARI